MDNFFLNKEGVWLAPPPNSKGEPSEPIWVCSPLEVLAITRDHDNENHGKLLRFYDYDGVEHRWPMPMELLAADGAAYRQILLSGGLQIKEGKQGRDFLSRYIQSSNPKERLRCVTRLGWYKDTYILPNTTIGNCENEKIVYQTHRPLNSYHEERGSLEAWKKEMSYFCTDNSRLSFCMSIAFAAPLLHFFGEENGGFHLKGQSSGGKTTVLKVALSVWGGETMLHTWRSTSNGLEAIAALHNDNFLCLDELGKLEPKIAGETAYLLVNGSGKQRCDRSGYARSKQSWRLLFLSSGEIGLPDLIRQAGQKVRGGHEVRVVDIPAFTGEHGVFEYLHGFSSGDEFSRMLCTNAEKYHGLAGKAFIREFLNDIPKYKAQVLQVGEEFKKENAPPGADGQVLRVLNRFSFIAAVGELVTDLGITNWPQEEALWAAKTCFQAWLKSRGGISAQEGLEILRQVRLFIEKNGDARFAVIGGREERIIHYMAGYKRWEDSGWHYFVFRETFKQEVCVGFDLRIATDTLIERGWLLPDSEGKSTRAESLPGAKETIRCYRLDGNKIFSDEM